LTKFNNINKMNVGDLPLDRPADNMETSFTQSKQEI